MSGAIPDFSKIEYGREIGRRVNRLMKDRDWTLKDLKNRMKNIGFPVSQATLSRIANSQRKDFNLGELHAFAVVFGVKIQELWIPEGGWE